MRVKIALLVGLLLASSVLAVGCGGAQPSPEPTAPDDLLAKILARGTLIVATDPGYPPQSELVAGASRVLDTACAPSEYTAQELEGFDVSTAVEIARRLGVEACFVTPPWTQLTAGNWDDRWDISVGSMAPLPDRMEVLYFTQPYYATAAALFVHEDNTTFSEPSDLSGHRVGGCANCTYEAYLQGTLVIPGTDVEFVIDDPIVVGYDVDLPALEDLALGDGERLDAALTAQPTGLQAIEDGLPIKQLGQPVFFEYLAAAIDKKSSQDPEGFVRRVSEIIQEMHSDGTLLRLSQQYYGKDYTTEASQFELAALGQLP
ncbi:MAG: transporter substrate-binding domain-containing protein [Anaerolineae bacterium]|nr:transporter substrate-binding domain-containing protein [Anaerolineae bacterium]